MVSIVHKLEKIREAKKVAKSTLADKIGVARETVYNWTDDNLKISTLQKACKALDIDIVQFFGHSDIKPDNIVQEPSHKYGKTPDDCAQVRKINEFLERQYQVDQSTIKALHSAIEALTHKHTEIKTTKKHKG